MTINELVDIVEGIAGVELERRYKLDAPQGVRGRNSDNTLIRERLGWAPSISLEDGLATTYAWVHDQVAGGRSAPELDGGARRAGPPPRPGHGRPGASSLSNVVVSIFGGPALPAEGFGAFGVAFVAFLLSQGVARALIGEPLLSRYSGGDEAPRRALVPDMLGATVVGGRGGVGDRGRRRSGLGDAVGAALLALACVLPLVPVQDTWRYVFIVDRPGAALLVDWCGSRRLRVPPAAPDAPVPPGSWWPGGWPAGWARSPAWWSGGPCWPGPLGRWLRANRDMGGRFLGEFATGQAVGSSCSWAGALAGLGVLAAGAGRAGVLRPAQHRPPGHLPGAGARGSPQRRPAQLRRR